LFLYLEISLLQDSCRRTSRLRNFKKERRYRPAGAERLLPGTLTTKTQPFLA
jgi:hypothetical protein